VTGSEPPATRGGPETRPRLAIDGARRPHVGPFRHLHSPRVRRRAHELDVDLEEITGTGPGGSVRPDDLERELATGVGQQVHSPSGAGMTPRLAIDGPRRLRVARFRHAHSPRVRRRARALSVDLGKVDGTGPSGRVTPADVETAAAFWEPHGHAPLVAMTAGQAHRAPERGSSRTVALDLGGAVVAWQALAELSPLEPSVFDVVAHAIIATLQTFAATIRPGHDGPIASAVARGDVGEWTVLLDGHDLTGGGMLRRVAETAPAGHHPVRPEGAAAFVTIREWRVRPQTDAPVRHDDVDLAVVLGAVESRTMLGRDDLGYETATIRPGADLVLRHDPTTVNTAAIDGLVSALQRRLRTIHRSPSM